jgi:hypothetical protein
MTVTIPNETRSLAASVASEATKVTCLLGSWTTPHGIATARAAIDRIAHDCASLERHLFALQGESHD